MFRIKAFELECQLLALEIEHFRVPTNSLGWRRLPASVALAQCVRASQGKVAKQLSIFNPRGY